MSVHYAESDYGFAFGSANVTRFMSDDKKGWVVLCVDTPKHSGHGAIQIYVTRKGKVRIHSAGGEWTPPKANP